jgi:hypothetical protein
MRPASTRSARLAEYLREEITEKGAAPAGHRWIAAGHEPEVLEMVEAGATFD